MKKSFKVDDMQLTKDQYLGQSQRENFRFANEFTLSADAYWNFIWNTTISKYMIPFSRHPSKEARESIFL